MKVNDLSSDELIDLAELLNQISLDLLDEPIECIDFAMMKSRGRLIRGILQLANGYTVDCLEEIQEFYDSVYENEES